jgi:hypothetical protein
MPRKRGAGFREAATNVRFGSTASIERSRHVGFTPDFGRMVATQRTDASSHCATSPQSFDHLVGRGEQDRWYREAQRFGGLEVNHQFELLRPLYR